MNYFEKFTLTILALEKLKELGYREVWIGGISCPHLDYTNKSFIVAAPKNRVWNSPSLWVVDEKLFGRMSCGNGLRNADQVQRNHNLMEGYYFLENNQWNTDIFNEKQSQKSLF